MIIELCPKGHRYDAAYFSECPHCSNEILQKEKQDFSKTKSQNPESRYKTRDSQRKSGFVQNIHTASDSGKSNRELISSDRINQCIHEVAKITASTEAIPPSQTIDSISEPDKAKKAASLSKKKTAKKPNIISDPSDFANYICMASMPEKLVKNQDFCIDLCLFETNCWRDGADMLSFKLKNGVRDIKTLSLSQKLPYTISIFYKEELLHKESILIEEIKNRIFTHIVQISDSRDRKLHLLKILIENTDCNYKEILFLQPAL